MLGVVISFIKLTDRSRKNSVIQSETIKTVI